METLYDDIPITVILSTPSRDIGIKNKDSAPTTPCDNQVPLETESTALKSFVVEQFFLIKKSIHEIKDSDDEAANSTYVFMLMEQIEYLKEEKLYQSITKYHSIAIISCLKWAFHLFLWHNNFLRQTPCQVF